MALDDRAIVVGIDTYPDIAGLEGAERDAMSFYDWLTAKDGGDVDQTRVRRILGSDYQPAAPAPAVREPTADAIERAFDALHREAVDDFGIARRLGRRLYVYAAGHGAGLPFNFDDDRSDVALLVADATQFNAKHVMARVYALYFLNAGIFDEIVVFLDCCRIPYSRLVPRFPSYMDSNAVGEGSAQARAFFAFATKWGLKSREKPMQGRPAGVFTTSLVRGLRGAAANPDGTVTSNSLRNYLLNHMQDLLDPVDLEDPDIPKTPDVPAPSVDMVFSTVAPPRVDLMVEFPLTAAGQAIQLRGDGFQVIARGTTVAGTPWTWSGLSRGGYLVQIPGAQLEKEFILRGDEGAFHVVL